MELTLVLAEDQPQPVKGQDWTHERLIAPRVLPGAAVRLAHHTPIVGMIMDSWRDGDTLMAEAQIPDRLATQVHTALTKSRAGSLEFDDLGDSELIHGVTSNGGSCMMLRGVVIGGVAIGLTNPARTDTRVAWMPATPPPPPRLVTRTPSHTGQVLTRRAVGDIRYTAPIGHVIALR